MGNGCCVTKDINTDLRDRDGRTNRPRTGIDQNTFKQKLSEPEFKVERRESIGLAAKEHTEMLMNTSSQVNGNQLGNSSRQTDNEGDPRNSDGFKMTEGTFNENSVLVGENRDLYNGSFAESKQEADYYEAADNTVIKSNLSVSFGGKSENNDEPSNLVASFNPSHEFNYKAQQESHAYKRITFGADRQPASPATTDNKTHEAHFK